MCYTPFFFVNSVVTVIVSSTNLCYICTCGSIGNIFTFIQYGTYNICPGPAFRCEFNRGVHFVTRLTIFGNFFVLYVFICVIHHFSCEYSVVTVIVSSTNLCYICNPWRNWEHIYFYSIWDN